MQHKGEQKVRYVTKSNRKGKKDQRQPLDLECKFSFFSEASQKTNPVIFFTVVFQFFLKSST